MVNRESNVHVEICIILEQRVVSSFCRVPYSDIRKTSFLKIFPPPPPPTTATVGLIHLKATASGAGRVVF
jgi:hypothetical protein